MAVKTPNGVESHQFMCGIERKTRICEFSDLYEIAVGAAQSFSKQMNIPPEMVGAEVVQFTALEEEHFIIPGR